MTGDGVRLGHLVLPVQDVSAGIRFLEGALGLALRFRDGDRYAAFEDAGGTLALAGPEEQVLAGAVAVGVKVADLEAAAARVRAHGGRVLGDPVETDHDRRLAFADPDGNVFVLTQARPAGR